ncbi:hypothetical protein CRG98_026691 [Punica granatum]|uniref:Uncharacterized protein n=1 Tax=Punica granatum TaxID=22663 RepID=A0A2I0JAG3_PUNGR|nr:hypothetical protein CRG98_026691 [Punica granatum]
MDAGKGGGGGRASRERAARERVAGAVGAEDAVRRTRLAERVVGPAAADCEEDDEGADEVASARFRLRVSIQLRNGPSKRKGRVFNTRFPATIGLRLASHTDGLPDPAIVNPRNLRPKNQTSKILESAAAAAASAKLPVPKPIQAKPMFNSGNRLKTRREREVRGGGGNGQSGVIEEGSWKVKAERNETLIEREGIKEEGGENLLRE